MLKKLFSLFSLFFILFITNIFGLAQSSENPINYRLAIRDFQTYRGGGYISVIDGLTQQEVNQILFPTAAFFLELSLDKKQAFLISASPTPTKGISIIDLTQGTLLQTLLMGEVASNAKVSPDGTLWVLLYDRQQIVLINPQNFRTISRISANDAPVDIAFSLDNSKAFVSLNNSNILVIDVQKKSVVKTITGIPEGRNGFFRRGEITISPDGTTLVINSKNTITVIDIPSLNVIDSFVFPNTSLVELASLEFSPDSKILYISEIQGFNLYACDFASKQITKIFTSTSRTIQDFTLSPDGRLLYVSSFTGRFIVDTKSNETIFSLQESRDPTTQPTFDSIFFVGDFTIGEAPKLETLSPMGNQQVMAGQPLTIKWQTTVAQRSFSIASHKVELSTDGGMSFSVIPGAERLKADVQQFTWQVPDIELLNKVQIRVSTVDLGARRANSTTGSFSIVKGSGQTGDTQAPMVSFLSPKGGERFTSGDSLEISWMSSDNVGVTSQDLSLSTDGGATFPITLVNGLAGTTQSFSFPIPMTLQSEQTRLRLIVRDSAGNSSQTVIPSNFRIELGADTIAPMVTISQPTANQSLIAGQPIQVRWQSTDNRAVVNQALLLSLDGGQTFATVSSFGANDNSFVINNIEELNITNSKGIVRITATDTSGNIGQANTQFSIAPAITNATYQSKTLNLTGIGFLSNSRNSTTRLFVNDKEIALTPKSISNNAFSIKANKKKLNIIKGNNTVRLIVDGVSSNTSSFTF
ncbi:MAG: PD40 domain-containing protein [Acidobacteria bacterium]|nr:PD40 domain-containing protein [Acidobacteriota bacterium]